MSKLLLVTDAGTCVEFDLRPGDNTLGRSAANHIVLASIYVSRRHAVVTVDDAFISIRDAGSQNGTFVNGERITSQVLVAGDVVDVGRCSLQFFQSNQEFRAVEAQGVSSVPNWMSAADPDHPESEPPTAREGPRSR